MIQTSTGLFIDTNNTVYATACSKHSVLVWPAGSASPTRSIFSDLSCSFGIFVTIDGDVYADNGNTNHRLEKWAANASNSTNVMSTAGRCAGVFVDIYDSVYCSLPDHHQVLKRSVGSDANTFVIVAGDGTPGSAPHLLSSPHGIFVDIDLRFHVADFGNNRIQLFLQASVNGTTVAGDGAPDTITLYQPTSVALDMDGYLFISDRSNHRIVGSGPHGFRCIAACSGSNGSAANQLYYPFALSFDSFGNLYVTDSVNARIQKFILARNACGESLRRCFCTRFESS